MVHIGYFELWYCCCQPNLMLHFTALPRHFFLWTHPLHCAFICFKACMLAVMLCIHKITCIHHAEGCKMHRGHYISLKVAAWLLHDFWRATVFLLHVLFYGHQLGAYNVFCMEEASWSTIMYFSECNGHPVIPSIIHPSITVVVSLTSSSRILAHLSSRDFRRL